MTTTTTTVSTTKTSSSLLSLVPSMTMRLFMTIAIVTMLTSSAAAFQSIPMSKMSMSMSSLHPSSSSSSHSLSSHSLLSFRGIGSTFTSRMNTHTRIAHHSSITTTSRRRSCGLRSLSMHMGHSHSHHHHHSHDHNTNNTNNNTKKKATPKTIRGKILHQLTRRHVIRTLFAAFVTLLPPLLLKRNVNVNTVNTVNNIGGMSIGNISIGIGRITKTNIALFALTSATLSLLESIKSEINYIIKRANSFKRNLMKHSPINANGTGNNDSNTATNTNTDGSSTSFNFKQSTIQYLFHNDNAADRVTFIGVIVNLLLSIGKACIGVTCHSSALIADAGHSLSDLFSDFITLWAVQIARLPPDDDHPYGHGKFEAVGSLFLALTLFGTGISVGAAANTKLLKILQASAAAAAANTVTATATGVTGAIAKAVVNIPTFPALIMAGISIASKEWLYRITKRVGEELNSQVVIANAWHHRSDAYSSILAMGSIALAMTVPSMIWADAAAGLLVGGMICMTGAEIMGESMKQLTDTSDEDLNERVKDLVASNESEDVLDVKRIRTRWMGSSAIVDLEICTKDNLSSSANRAIEERVKFQIMDQEPGIIDVDVHATSNTVVCPLLTATGAMQEDRKSVQEVVEDTRELLLSRDEVESVERCTVHYEDTLLATVDANIKLKDPDLTINSAVMMGKELKMMLQESEDIHKANIYLDLNESVVPTTKEQTIW